MRRTANRKSPPSGTLPLLEQLGARSSARLVGGDELWGKAPFGALSRLKISREQRFAHLPDVHPFVEQLGVPSGVWGVSKPKHVVNALMGLGAKWKVSKHAGFDLHGLAHELIETRVLPLPMPSRRKALLLSTLYAVAGRLPQAR